VQSIPSESINSQLNSNQITANKPPEQTRQSG
jgi:hypothetical protein